MTCSTEVHRGVTYIIDQSHEFWVVVRGIVPSFSKQKVKKYLIQSLKEIEKEDKPLTITLFPDEVRLLHSTRNINDPLLSLSHEEFRNIISFCTDK